MREHLGMVVVVAVTATGCLDQMPEETAEVAQGLSIRCPDPDDCTLSNGGGVLTEELGFAGIGPDDFVINRFVNNSNGTVSIRGGQYDAAQNWVGSTQSVAHAYYAPYGPGAYPVTSVSETGTVPTFTLSSPTGTFTVTGNDIVNLRLVILLDGVAFTLSWWNPQTEVDSSSSVTAPLHSYYMRWNPNKTFDWATSLPYCYQAPVGSSQSPDPVVFQQGFGIDPVTATIAINDNYTTMSCRHGAPATVRWWGYAYRGGAATTDMFEAAMHMKRASYCGDETFYTRAGTDILIRDTVSPTPIQNDALSATELEASWGRTIHGVRATCVNMAKRRRPGANYPPNASGTDFNHTCADGTTVPDCAYGAFGSLASQRTP